MKDSTEDSVLACADKLAFDSEKQAKAAAIVAAHQHGSEVEPYNCGDCGLWHLKTVY